ncbi:hypothetical protein [Arthrobacter sp. UYCu712]|uniref:LEM-3-like GIY-YIG domain-containing protein n=1 Tax=Arthrobacter sp. UYCu712 TaxID=3156340 RepID=UPI0033954312
MLHIDQAVLDQVSSELQAYVYLLVDPGSGVPFYVGRGHGLRHAVHVAEALVPFEEDAGERSRKLTRIDEILAAGREPEVWILRYGLRPGEYTAVEAAAIDLLMSFPILSNGTVRPTLPLAFAEQITNARREQARGHGVTLLQSLIDEFAAPPLTTMKPLLLITLNGLEEIPAGQSIAGGRVRYSAGFKPEWLTSAVRRQSFAEIGESVSAWWRLKPDEVAAWGIEYVVAVHRGVTRALFRIVPDSWEFDTSGRNKNGDPIRYTAFQVDVVESGSLFEEIVGAYGRRVPALPPGAQNAIGYWPRRAKR